MDKKEVGGGPASQSSRPSLSDRLYANRRLYFFFVFAYVALTAFFDYFSTSFRYSATTYVREDFGVSFGTITGMFTWVYLGSCLAILPRFLADIYGRKLMLWATLTSLCLFQWLVSFATGPVEYIALLTLLAVWYRSDIWLLVIAEEAPHERRGIYAAVSVACGLMGALVVGQLIRTMGAELDGWRTVSRFPIWGVVAALPLLFILRDRPNVSATRESRSFATAFQTLIRPFRGDILRQLIVISLIKAVFVGGIFATVLLIQFEFLRNENGFSPEFVGRTLQLEVLASALAAIFAGFFADRLGRRRTFFACTGIFSLAILLFATLPKGSYGVIAAHVTQSAAATAANTILRIGTLELFPNDCRATGSAWSDLFVTLTAAGAAVFLGRLVSPVAEGGYAFDLSTVLIGLCVLPPLVAPLYLLLHETRGIDLDEVPS